MGCHKRRRQDERWTKKITDWNIINTRRQRARRMARWRDEIAKFGTEIENKDRRIGKYWEKITG